MREPTPRQAPTARQATVLRFIRKFAARRGYPPTYAEIAEGLAFRSQNAAREHVRLLALKELLVVEPGRARGLRVVAADDAPARELGGDDGLPVVGEVAAGQPILAQENVERTLAVDRAAFAPRADFLLRVRGDSMIEAGIEPDDLLAVHRTASVRDGQIAVVRLDDDVTVKRWRTRTVRGGGAAAGGRRKEVVLEPANRALSPIVVDPTRVNVAVEGLVVGLIRSLGARLPGAVRRTS
jgi:repressor LexA